MTNIAHQLPSSPADTAHNRQNHHEIDQNCHPSTNDLQQYTGDHAKSAPKEIFFGADLPRPTDHPRSSAIIDEQNRSNPIKSDHQWTNSSDPDAGSTQITPSRSVPHRTRLDTPVQIRTGSNMTEHHRTPPNKAGQQRTPATSRHTRVCRGNHRVGEQLSLRDPQSEQALGQGELSVADRSDPESGERPLAGIPGASEPWPDQLPGVAVPLPRPYQSGWAAPGRSVAVLRANRRCLRAR